MTLPKLKPCPFCGVEIDAPGSPFTRDIKTAKHPTSDCILSGHDWWMVPRFIEPWNTRTDSIPAPGADYVALHNAVEKHLTWFERFICDRDELDSSTPRKVADNAKDAAVELHHTLSSRPTDARVVTVAQLRKWAATVKTYTQDYTIAELGDDLFTLGEIRAIIGGQANE